MWRWMVVVALCGLVLTTGVLWGVEDTSADAAARDDGPVRVRGESAQNRDRAALLQAEPGWYRSTAPGMQDVLHHRVQRSTPGSDLTVGIAVHPPEVSENGYLIVELSTVEGTRCEITAPGDPSPETPESLAYASVTSSAGGENEQDARKCAQADRFVLQVTQDDVRHQELSGARMDVVVNEEPLVTNTSELPKPGEQPTWVPQPPSGRTEVEGVRNPPSAEPLRPGSYRSTISPGERLFFRVDLDWGQAPQAQIRRTRPGKSARAAIRANDGDVRLHRQVSGSTFVNARASGKGLDEYPSTTVSATKPSELRMTTPRVRYRNRTAEETESINETSAPREASAAGPYYLVVTLSDASQDYGLPIDLELTTRGDADAPPEYADSATGLGPTLGTVNFDRNTTAFCMVAGGSLLFLVGAGTLVTTRIRSAVRSRTIVRA